MACFKNGGLELQKIIDLNSSNVNSNRIIIYSDSSGILKSIDESGDIQVITNSETYPASAIIYDNTGTNYISGNNIQDAITKLDETINTISISAGAISNFTDLLDTQQSIKAYVDSTAVSISGYVQNEINLVNSSIQTISGDVENLKVDVANISSSLDSIVLDASTVTYTPSSSSDWSDIGLIPGFVDQALDTLVLNVNQIPGIIFGSVILNESDLVYTVSNSEILSTSKPIVTLVAPTSANTVYVQAVTNINVGAFDIILSGVPGITGYEANWLIAQ